MATQELTRRDQCNACRSKEPMLLTCRRCKLVQYCSKECRKDDRPHHRSLCRKVKATRKQLVTEEQELRAAPADPYLHSIPGDVFEVQVGHFWGLFHTRPYIRARYAHIDTTLKIKSAVAVERALDHCLDLHRLCRSDNMGLRFLTPHLLLRLCRDQEAYDFLCWYATRGPDYDWGNVDLPYLNIKGADVFEDVAIHIPRFPHLSHLVAVTLIKIRLLKDLQALQNSRIVLGNVPQEMKYLIQSQLVSPIVANNFDIMRRGEHQGALILRIESQIDRLYCAVNKANKHFWPTLLKPGDHLGETPDYTCRGEASEMQLTLQQSYDGWNETPAAIDFIRKMRNMVDGDGLDA